MTAGRGAAALAEPLARAAELAAVLLAGCAGRRQARAAAARAARRRRSPRQRGLESAHRRRAVPARRVGGRRAASFTVAGNDGTVVALEADTGRELWRGSVGAKLSAGVGSDGRFAAVVTRDGDLVVLEPAGSSGARRWARVSRPRRWWPASASSCSAWTAPCRPSTRSTAASSGRCSGPGDPLTLAQSGVLAAFKDTLVVGQGPRMAGRRPAARHAALGGDGRLAARRQRDRAPGRPGRAAGAHRRPGLRALVPGGRRLRQCRARHASSGRKTIGGIDGDRRRRAAASFGADASDRITAWKTAERRRRLDHRQAAVPRPERAVESSAGRWCSATTTARCTGSPATTAKRSCA